MSGTQYTKAQLQAIAVQDANKYGVPQDLFLDQISQESSWNPNPPATGTSTATGIAQFLKGTAAQYNLDPTDPVASLDAAAHYDADLYKANGNNWNNAINAYSGGNYDANSLYAKYGNMDTVTINPTTDQAGIGGTGAAGITTYDPYTGAPINAMQFNPQTGTMQNVDPTAPVNPGFQQGVNAGQATTNALNNATAGINSISTALANLPTLISAWLPRIGIGLLGAGIIFAAVMMLGRDGVAKSIPSPA